MNFQRGRFVTNRVPFIRWTTAPAFRALAGLELARKIFAKARPGYHPLAQTSIDEVLKETKKSGSHEE